MVKQVILYMIYIIFLASVYMYVHIPYFNFRNQKLRKQTMEYITDCSCCTQMV